MTANPQLDKLLRTLMKEAAIRAIPVIQAQLRSQRLDWELARLEALMQQRLDNEAKQKRRNQQQREWHRRHRRRRGKAEG